MKLCLGGPILENPEAVIALSVKCLACGLDVLRMKDRFPVGVKSLLKISQTSCGSQTFSSSVVEGVLTPGKRRPMRDAPDSPHLVLGLRKSAAVLLPLHTLSTKVMTNLIIAFCNLGDAPKYVRCCFDEF
jgi:hypothetical protein